MKIHNKVFKIQVQKPITSSHIENTIKDSGYEPLRWAIVKANTEDLIIEATVIKTGL